MTDRDKDIQELYAKGMRQLDIANLLGISRQRVYQIILKTGKGGKDFRAEKQQQRVMELAGEGVLSVRQIACEVGVSSTCVRVWLGVAGIPALKQEVCELYTQGKRQVDIAVMLGITPQKVSRTIKGWGIRR